MTEPARPLPTPSHEDIAEHAAEASQFLKTLSHETRLMILCILSMESRSVGELEAMLGARQAAVSQQLARLRAEGMVSTRREGKTIYYSIADKRAQKLIETLAGIFCAPETFDENATNVELVVDDA